MENSLLRDLAAFESSLVPHDRSLDIRRVVIRVVRLGGTPSVRVHLLASLDELFVQGEERARHNLSLFNANSVILRYPNTAALTYRHPE